MQILVFVQVLARVRVLQVGLIHSVQHVCFRLIVLEFKTFCVLFCLAVCTSSCQNGGTCSAPNTCTCTSQWTGQTCTIRKFHFKL